MTSADSSSTAQRVAIVGDDDPTFVEDLRAALQGAGIRSRVLTVSTLKKVARTPDLTLILGDAVQDGGIAVVDAVGEERGPFAVVLAAGSLSVRLEARTRGLLVIPRPDDGAALGRDVERMLDSGGSATDVTTGSPRMAMNPGAPVADLGWEDDSETIQHVEPEVAKPGDADRDSLPEIGSGPSGLGRTFPQREMGYRTTLQGLSPGDQDVTVAASESTTEELKERSSRPGEQRSTQPESRRSTKPDPSRSTQPESRRSTKPDPGNAAPHRERSTRPESRGRNTRPGRRKALPEAETRMVADPLAALEAKTKMQPPPGPPSSETRVVPDPTAPLYEETTRHAPYTKRLADAVDDPDATAPHRALGARKPTARQSERPSRRPAKPASELPPSTSPKRPSTPPRRSQPPPRGVSEVEQPDTAQLASPRRVGPPSAPSAPSAPPIPLLPKPPQPVDARYSKPPPPAKPPARKASVKPAAEEESESVPIPLLPKRATAAPVPVLPAPEPTAEAIANAVAEPVPPPRSRWPIAVAALLLLGSLAGAGAWLMRPMASSPAPAVGAADPRPVGAPIAEVPGQPAPPDTDEPTPSDEPRAPQANAPETNAPETNAPEPDGPAEPVDVATALRDGRRHLRARRWDTAREVFGRALSQGENPDAHEGLAQVALAQENAAEALEHAEAAVRLRRTRARYHRLLGDARRLGGDEPGARRAYERAVSLDPEDEAADRLRE